MSMQSIRALFLSAANGKLRLDQVKVQDGPLNAQVLCFTGWHSDGIPFAFASAPFYGDPYTRSIQIAVDLVAAHTGRRMSLLGKMNALTEAATDFHTQTGAKLDELQARLPTLAAKRDQALAKHHSYYDGIEKGMDESTVVIDRLSNGPLDGSSEG